MCNCCPDSDNIICLYYNDEYYEINTKDLVKKLISLGIKLGILTPLED